ncbi:MAG: 4-(cytidine 5'-diphospho)-2-C-methyl-D-erythritol kinase [Trueperaceae bacterium]|nr:4-(cytidine 5'-diphospho)-2-C-methyl-D-erythritol kinase [Trueperaceae bacterium]
MSDAPEVVTVVAPAKVNLGLRVSARRGDGYHEIDTLFATVEIGDRLRLSRTGTGVSGVVTDRREPGSGAEEVPPMGPANLAFRAADAWLEAAGRPGGVHVELEKQLPIAAGLGGGSSDAGAVIRAMARLWPAAVDPIAIAKRLGSDVPFFASGHAVARGRGRGEKLAPRALPARWLVLVNPGVAVPVAQAYGDLMAFGPPQDWDAVASAWSEGQAPRWRNDLQAGVLRRHPDVRAAWTALGQAGLAAPLLSGSGATCFGLADGEEHARRVARELRAGRPDWWVIATSAPARSAFAQVR